MANNQTKNAYYAMINSFDALVSGQYPGTKLTLATRLLKNVLQGMDDYNDKMAPDLTAAMKPLAELQIAYKARSEARQLAREAGRDNSNKE